MRFAYDDNGLRIKKTTNGHATTYYYDGDMLIAQETNSYKWVFIYDESGSPIGYAFREHSFQYEWDVYWYTKNLQGDITAIYTNGGTKIVSYVYDAWGNFTSTYTTSNGEFHASTNPFTYRGYYYDHDLQMYYLQTRYYDPVVGRFINADSYVSTGQGLIGNNMFAYCNNNPVMYVDPTGESSTGWFIVILLVCLLTLTKSEYEPGSITNPEELMAVTDITNKVDEHKDEPNIEIKIDISDANKSSDFLVKYTDVLADKIEKDYSEFLSGKVDRCQLYSEIKFHIVCWENQIATNNANPANINVYYDGSVVDPRGWLNTIAKWMYGDEYE